MNKKLYDINYLDIEANDIYEEIISKVIDQCFDEEGLIDSNMYVNIILTTPKNIRTFNKKFRNIDKETDVLSFPMFEKEDFQKKVEKKEFEYTDILGDMIISIPRVEEQAKEYGHGFERELAYMVVHSFYHLLGYDHIQDKDKQEMRKKEENILSKLNINR